MAIPRNREKNRLNTLDGKTWTRYSISIWDIEKSSDEARLSHPALFPQKLADRLIQIYAQPGYTILDPFMGIGTTLLAAQECGCPSIGFDVSPHYINIAEQRLAGNQSNIQIFCEDARNLARHIPPNSVDLIVSSPPYWNIHHQRRTADGKTPRPYTISNKDLGNIQSYTEFLQALQIVAEQLFSVLKPGRWCILIVMDLRKKDRFYPFHIDCIQQWTNTGFQLEDIIVWDRRKEYHNLRPLGYPTTFRVNKVHEYILIFLKPDC
ncbi:MAG: TRM11 family SAM-dependent methyltransferase [Promethearchaeota archaeon]